MNQAFKGAICFICTESIFHRKYDEFISFSNKVRGHQIYILILDYSNDTTARSLSSNEKRWGRGSEQLQNIFIISPETIGLDKIRWKQFAFELTIVDFILKISSYMDLFLINKTCDYVTYIDFKLLTKKFFIFKERIEYKYDQHKLIIYHNTSLCEYLYHLYPDNKPILKIDREKYLNMHVLEKEQLGDPFLAKIQIRKIMKVIGASSKENNQSDLKEYQGKIDDIFSHINLNMRISLVIYIMRKIVRKILHIPLKLVKV